MVTHLSTVCVAALQEQRVALGTRYEVPEVSFSNSHCNTWSTSLHYFGTNFMCILHVSRPSIFPPIFLPSQTNLYNKLKFFTEDTTYWAPASTTSGLYSQLAAKKYREIPRNQIQYVPHNLGRKLA